MAGNFDSQFQSDPEIENTDDLVHELAKELENLVVSCNNNDDNQVTDRDRDEHEVIVIEEDKRSVDDEIQVMEVNNDVSEDKHLSENGAKNRGECRVLENLKGDETEILGQNHVNEVDIEEENYENEMKNGDYGGEIRVYGWSDDGNDRENDDNQVSDRDRDEHEIIVIEEDKRAVDDEIQVMEVKNDVSENLSENGAKNRGECRVLENLKGDEIEILGQNYVNEVDIEEENYENEMKNGDYGGEIGVYGWSDDGIDREYTGDLADNASGWEGIENGAGEWGEAAGGGSVNVNVPSMEDDDDDNGRLKSYQYPVRPDAEDCSYYIRTGMCKYGTTCKFNHPLKKSNQPYREIRKPREDNNQMERPGQIECKFFLSTGGCKYGKACKFNHGIRGKTAITEVLEYNFLGLPIRPGEKECPYYMRNGSCKYGSNCRFNHPDPAAVGGNDSHPPAAYGNDGSVSLQKTSQPYMTNMPSWSAPRNPDPHAAFVPMMYPQTQNIPPPSPDWNSYQAPIPATAHVYPSSERGYPIPPPFFLNNPPSDTKVYTHHQQQQMLVSEYPERPGQPECSYFMNTGDCKFKSTCKFHHPKSRTARTAPSVFTDKGLPLRPDQNICAHYSRYGICKYGSACKYDHPVNFSQSGGGGGYRSDGRPLMQQSV